jgi:hypothetical protein
VHEVGDFVASFVPGVDDFARLDPRFSIPKTVWSAIPEYADYGFAVFQLKETSGSPHPIAFEWKTRLRDSIYFPTVHIHDGTVHAEDTFHHVLYLQEARFDARVGDYDGPEHADPTTGYIRSKSKASLFVDTDKALGAIDGDLLLHKTSRVGLLPNKDTFKNLVDWKSDDAQHEREQREQATASKSCGLCATSADEAMDPIGPAGTALMGLAWVIRRRNLLRRTNASSPRIRRNSSPERGPRREKR